MAQLDNPAAEGVRLEDGTLVWLPENAVFRYKSWKPRVEIMPEDPGGFCYHGYAVHKTGFKDLMGKYVNPVDAWMGAEELSNMYATNRIHPRILK